MAVLVCFHAHPDDEALSTGGLMRKAADLGHTVILVTATRGEAGEVQPGVLSDGEVLAERRVRETDESARILGCRANEFLGYEDSGMVGTEANHNPASFWRADLDRAAERLAAILTRVRADVLTVYDENGIYGHPDHLQVHRVGLRAAELAGVEHVYEATVNRDHILRMSDAVDRAGPDGSERYEMVRRMAEVGLPEQQIHYVVDVRDQTVAKRAAMRAHRTQIADDSLFLSTSDEDFGELFGREFFAVPGRAAGDGPEGVDLLPGLSDSDR